jgi:hypothetical protein
MWNFDIRSDAWKLQDTVRQSEQKQREQFGMDYGTAHVRQSIIHTREDVVLVVHHLCEVKNSLKLLVKLLFVCAIMLSYLAYRLS